LSPEDQRLAIRQDIEKWLTDWGITAKEEDPPNESIRWIVSFQPESAFRIVVARKAVDYSWLQMETGLTLAEEHRQILVALDEDARDRFMLDFRIKMASMPVGYSLNFSKADTIMEGITIGLNILEDPLLRSGFFRRHHQIQSAAQVAVLMVQKMARFQAW
jgi:hypothetical protein